MHDFVEMIFQHAAIHPNRAAVITGEGVLSYRMLRAGILAVSEKLRAEGLKEGDRVGIHVANALGHVAVLCALHRLGMVSVSMERPQVESLNSGLLQALLTDAPVPGTGTRMVLVDETWFGSGTEPAAPPALSLATAPTALCRLVFSSGTTGQPKIIALSRQAVLDRCRTYAIRMSDSWERLVCMPGLSTNYGYSFTVTALFLGRTICFPIGANARQLIVSYQADVLVASTHQISTIVKAQEEEFVPLDTLRTVHIGGSIAYAPLLTRIRMLVCNNILCGYGSTEGGTVAYAPVDLIFGVDRAVGVLAPWIELQTIDESGKPTPFGTEGEIRLKALGQGYRARLNEANELVVENNEWFSPGDMGILYKNALLLITGRVNEIINRGGVKVSPETIEEEVRKFPGIADLAAVGVLDAIGLEQIWLALVSEGQAVDIGKVYDLCRERIPHLLPDRVFEVPAIPRNRLGKVEREKLKIQLQELEATQAYANR